MELRHNVEDFEARRVQELNSYTILDSASEDSFDRLAELASKICNTPIALISFIDLDRQWVKASVGLDIHEVPRQLSSCNDTIERYDYCEVEDFFKEADRPSVQFMKKHGIRFYTGVPISTSNGYNIGSLCVIDYTPRKLSKEQIQSLRLIAGQIKELLEIRRSYNQNLLGLKRVGKYSFNNDRKIQDLIHKGSMRSIAELATGLSYKLNTQLTILNNSRKMLKTLVSNQPPDVIYEFDLIELASENIEVMLDSLDKYVRAEQERWMKPLELDRLVSEVVNNLEHRFESHGITLKVNLLPELICIGNITHLYEVIHSLIMNAIEAVDEVETREIEIKLEKSGHQACLQIMDSGNGVSVLNKPFIFQPFFTTKGKSGIGIGLSLAEAILHQHMGEIELVKDSSPTTFKITIPVP